MPLFRDRKARKSRDEDSQQSSDANDKRSKSKDSRRSEKRSAAAPAEEDAPIPKRSDTPNLRQRDPPVSHHLTREHIQKWRNSTSQIKATFPYVDLWPCMYCLGCIDFRYREKCSRFHCENPECAGKGKVQVTCFWDVKAGIKKKKEDNQR